MLGLRMKRNRMVPGRPVSGVFRLARTRSLALVEIST